MASHHEERLEATGLVTAFGSWISKRATRSSLRAADMRERAFAPPMKCDLVRIPLSVTPATVEESVVKVIEDA